MSTRVTFYVRIVHTHCCIERKRERERDFLNLFLKLIYIQLSIL